MVRKASGVYMALPLLLASVATAPLWAQEASTPAATTLLDNPNATKPEEIPIVPVVEIPQVKSLLFSNEDISSIQKARLSYEQRIAGVSTGKIDEQDFLKNLETMVFSKIEPTVFTYPQFFLSSIAYYSTRDWVVWINNEKITQNSGISTAGLRVIDIDNEKAIFEWFPENLDKIVDPGEYSQENQVRMDMANKKVMFVLKPHQTFSSYAMRVVEGKLLPVTVSVKSPKPEFAAPNQNR